MFTLVSAIWPGLDQGLASRALGALDSVAIPVVLYSAPEFTPVGSTASDRRFCLRPLTVQEPFAGLQLAEALAARVEAEALYGPTLWRYLDGLCALERMHAESLRNPFETEGFVWIDARLLATMNPAYLQDRDVLVGVESLLEKALFTSVPDTPLANAVTPGFIGARAATLAEIQPAYWQVCARVLASRRLPGFAALIAEVDRRLPGRIRRCCLQSNGLIGSLFESVRSGRVHLEHSQYVA